jgi:large subunit ribosomal protein L24
MKRARKTERHTFRFRKGDTVVCLTGDDRGKHGKVLQVLPASGRALVEGLNLVTKHLRKSQEHPKGAIVKREASIHASNLRKQEAGDAKKSAAS